MTVEIAGLLFDEMPNSLSSVDHCLDIYNTEGTEQGFSFSTLMVGRFKQLFSVYNCSALAFNLVEPDGELNLDDVVPDHTVKKLHINTHHVINVRFRGDKVYFPMLQELLVLSKWPTAFPRLTEHLRLRSLTIKYEKGNNSHWALLSQIEELIIYEYDEPDLKALSRLRGLTRLQIVQGKMQSLEGIEALPNLQTLVVATAAKLGSMPF